MEYGTWIRLVDDELERAIGLSHRDLSDRNWRDEYDSDYTPREAALEALAENGLEELADELEIAGAIDQASGAVHSDADPGL